MEAVVCTKYGSLNVLQLRDIAKPTPKKDEAPVKIHASSVNAADVETMRGVFVVRLTASLKPMHKILGSDVAERVEAVGRNVPFFQPGDEIWGNLSYSPSFGAFADYVCIPEDTLRLKPANMTFEEAAAVPTAAVVELQNLCAKRPIQPGKKVLINGAGGSVGTFALQLAKHFGAEVTAVCSTANLELVKFLGADHVIDYTKEDFTRSGKTYDIIFDVVAKSSFSRCKQSLSEDGIYLCMFPTPGVLLPRFGRKKAKFIATGLRPPADRLEDLHMLKNFMERHHSSRH